MPVFTSDGDENARVTLEDRVRSPSGPMELGATGKLLVELPLSNAALQQPVAVYAGRRTATEGDYQSFVWSLTQGGLIEIVKALTRKEQAPREAQLQALRSYIETHLRGERCTHTARDRLAKMLEASQYAEMFNRLLDEQSPAVRAVRPIAADELSPKTVHAVPAQSPYWQSAKARRLLGAVKHLRFGDGTSELSEQQRRDQDWQAEFDRF